MEKRTIITEERFFLSRALLHAGTKRDMGGEEGEKSIKKPRKFLGPAAINKTYRTRDDNLIFRSPERSVRMCRFGRAAVFEGTMTKTRPNADRFLYVQSALRVLNTRTHIYERIGRGKMRNREKMKKRMRSSCFEKVFSP